MNVITYSSLSTDAVTFILAFAPVVVAICGVLLGAGLALFLAGLIGSAFGSGSSNDAARSTRPR